MLKPEHISWFVSEEARLQQKKYRERFGDNFFDGQVMSLRRQLCTYFATGNCDKKVLQISPMGGRDGAKFFKVRWALPGAGKSGGLRIGIVVWCEIRRVRVVHIVLRRDADTDPIDDSFDDF